MMITTRGPCRASSVRNSGVKCGGPADDIVQIDVQYEMIQNDSLERENGEILGYEDGKIHHT